MSASSTPVLQSPDAHGRVDPAWWCAGLAITALLAFSATHLWTDVWDDEAYAHGPIIVALIVWLVWKQPVGPLTTPTRSEQALGWSLLLPGLALYVVGRSQSLPVLDVGGLPLIATGLLLLTAGRSALRTYAYPLFFLLFLIPVPTPVLEIVTGPMRYLVSLWTEAILFAAGYPIGRSGVVLTIGQYQLLVAEACSGLNSLLSLSAMALLYIYLMQHRNALRNGLLLLAILPIAFAANLMRVIFLVLLTYHAGDEAGQGFMHDFSGLFLFVLALLLLFGLDRVLGWVPSLRARRPLA